jgi:hypothetical protein
MAGGSLSVRGDLFQKVLYRIGTDGPPTGLSGINRPLHSLVKPSAHQLVHLAISGGGKAYTSGFKVFHNDGDSPEPIGHGRLPAFSLSRLFSLSERAVTPVLLLHVNNRGEAPVLPDFVDVHLITLRRCPG